MIPPELVQLGTVGIIALALYGVVQAMKPGLAALVKAQSNLTTVNAELLQHLRESDRVIDRNAEAQEHSAAETHEMRLAITALAAAQTELVKALPDTVANIVKANADTAARLDAHDAQAREGIARIEAAIAELRAEIQGGHKAQRGEVIGRLDLILAELASLKPPPPPPKVMPITAPEPDTLLEKTA